MTPKEAAQWMLEELERRKFLDQEMVAWHLHKLKADLTYENANGNIAISKSVLDAFRALTNSEEFVWSRSERQWRYRQRWDKPGRNQD